MVGLFDHLSNLIARFRGKPDLSHAPETASVAARRLGLGGHPAPPPVQEAEYRSPDSRASSGRPSDGRSTEGAIADLRHAMAEADKRQARTDTDASLLLAVLLTKGHGLNRAQALQLHDDLMRGSLREADRKTLRALYRKLHGREFTCRVPAGLMD
ncbi:MAG TPA: hypothetical protein VEX87_26665 [Skermanella sp.]|jgi:hypothetical protein|nr:hypothetical protein [Skermanella sp.]